MQNKPSQVGDKGLFLNFVMLNQELKPKFYNVFSFIPCV